jgi:hypothetical protein
MGNSWKYIGNIVFSRAKVKFNPGVYRKMWKNPWFFGQ